MPVNMAKIEIDLMNLFQEAAFELGAASIEAGIREEEIERFAKLCESRAKVRADILSYVKRRAVHRTQGKYWIKVSEPWLKALEEVATWASEQEAEVFVETPRIMGKFVCMAQGYYAYHYKEKKS